MQSAAKAAAGSGPGAAAAVAKRTVFALWFGLAVSLLGDYFYRVGLTWNVTSEANGAGRGAALGAAMALPIAALGMFAGPIVDRYRRPVVMIVTDVLRFVLVGVLGLLFIGAAPHLGIVMVGAALLAGAGVCFTPALQAWLPDLFEDRDRMIRFDALFLSTVSATGVVGPAVAGLLYPMTGVAGLLLLDAVTFGVSAGAVAYLMWAHPSGQGAAAARAQTPVSPPAPAVAAPRPGLLKGIVEGLAYIFSNPVLRPQFSVYPFMECVTYGLTLMLPAYLATTHNAASWLFGTLLAANAAGRMAGAWLFAHTPLRNHRGPVLSLNHLTQGLALVAFAMTKSPTAGLVAFVVMGLPAGAAQIAVSSWVQLNVERHLRGRAFGTLNSLVLWLMPLGPVVLGWLGAWQGPRFALFAAATLFCLGGAVVASSRAVRELR